MKNSTTPALDRLPPHSIESEQGVLGCALLSPASCLPQIVGKISDDSFYDLRHQIIFSNLAAMHREGVLVDTITFQQKLKDAGLLDQIGGISYLSIHPRRCSQRRQPGHLSGHPARETPTAPNGPDVHRCCQPDL